MKEGISGCVLVITVLHSTMMAVTAPGV